MTIEMPDSIYPANLPAGFPAYLGYADGRWPTASQLRQQHPGAHILSLTVLGGSQVADGCDIENGDLSPASGAAWLHWRISSGQQRPVAYASRDTIPAVLTELALVGVGRPQVRVLSAHYGAGQHICGPGTCKASFQADGTQWTDTYSGVGGALIDMSLLADSFFGATPPPAAAKLIWPAAAVLRYGSTGAAVGALQQAFRDSGIYGVRGITVDEVFGTQTQTAVRNFEAAEHLAVDEGIAGPQVRNTLIRLGLLTSAGEPR